MARRNKKRRGHKSRKKKSRFSFIDKYALSISFLVMAALLVTRMLPNYNPMLYLIIVPVIVRLLFDVLTKKTVGSRILRTLHPKILIVDIVVFTVGLVGLYVMGVWTLNDISIIMDVLNFLLHQFGYTVNVSDSGATNITALP